MDIMPIQYGKTTIPESMCFENGSREKIRPIVFKSYLIKTEEKLILVDAGCETMPWFEMQDFIGSVKALENIGITPEQITDVLITHSHHDHIECVKYFKKATIHIQKDEYDRGKKHIPDNFKVNIFSDEFSVCEYVKIIKIGGHSQGSSIVEIKNNNKTYVIVGDECYLRECFERNIPTGSSFNKEKSKNFIKKYHDTKYTILMCHDV